ncbi:hypothetical protein CRE_03057 [Caenorhabditis remanei]|uniref:Uncharacterized protein n=1 Tax=Caenorhabditis remanei TaxID=31234 RepID=E3LWC4_CAERE|nr:hypothetical protein CRE_03057 [Caenorhabditis remanei]
MASQITAKHHGSKLRFLPVSSANMAFVNGDLKKSIATRPDGSVLHSNHSVTSENLTNSKYFIIDHESYMFCTITQSFKDISSLTTFMICPDAVYENTSHNMFLKGTDPIVLYSSDGELVMDVTQAVFFIFQSVVCGVNLNVKVCKTCQSDKCMDNYKAEVLAAMKEYSSLRDGSYVLKEEVLKKIEVLKTHCSFINQKNFPKQDYMMVNEDIMKRKPLKVYQNIIDSYEIPEDISATGLATAPVWGGRYGIRKAWSNNFFGSTNTNIKMLVLDGLLQKVPKEMKCVYELEHVKVIEQDCFNDVDDGRPMQLSDVFGGSSDGNPQSSLFNFFNLMQNCSTSDPVVKKNMKKNKK